MSTLVCWVGIDPRGVASAYIATDSRVSFGGAGKVQTWDTGQKCYSSSLVPLIVGYVGSAFYPVHLAPRVIAYAEAIWELHDSASDLLAALCRFMASAMAGAPQNDHFMDSELVFATRSASGEFAVAVVTSRLSDTTYALKQLPMKSGIVHSCGSGALFLQRKFQEWQQTRAADTSRGVYSAFCDSLLYENPEGVPPKAGLGKDPASEGPPQLVGIYRKWPGRNFGVAWKGGLYFAGVRVATLGQGVQCRNELFELCSPVTLKPIQGAKRHVDEPTLSRRAAASMKTRRG